MLTYNEITNSEAIKTYIIRADESLGALGYTEHSFAHVMHVAETAGYILETMGYEERTVELAKIAGYLHDIGNLEIERIIPNQVPLWLGVSSMTWGAILQRSLLLLPPLVTTTKEPVFLLMQLLQP